MNKHSVYKTNSFYWDTKGNDSLGAIVLPFYGAFISEEKCRLFGDISGKKMLEIGCGDCIPVDYFDFVYSIYAVGWTTDLDGTFSRIVSYLKKDGVFIFSWSHPIHKCVVEENNMLVFNKSYFDESWYSVSQDLCQGKLTLSDRKLSTYVNALAKAGFVIEQMIEETDDEILQLRDENSDFVKRAKMFPVTFVIKARKL